ncbi:MrcB family domain-containing protein [Halodesulfovibrio aestuarii]|uniref:HNH endonuclease n=1 Tax=Halodesulfovibrio aestuarii TaxID=126333 RepID=A0A8G2CCB6_9BACT|nr:DUF3578 domain-containing protein [Halodesulfovibrio aestuarii]SHJ76863.1 HNH endonuclease [Halodesulfovibrio aestuarii]
MSKSSSIYPVKSFSWTLLSSNIAQKQLDKSAFFHNGSRLPKHIRPFFNCQNHISAQNIILRYKGKEYQAAVVYKQKINRFNLMWRAAFSKQLAKMFPDKKRDSGVLKFTKLRDDFFDVELLRCDSQRAGSSITPVTADDTTSIKECLHYIMKELQRGATGEEYTDHPLACFIRGEFKEELESAIDQKYSSLKISTSAGAGQWASVVWGAVLDPIVTATATKGYYLVYLFHSSGKKVFLSLNQGATAVEEEFKGNAKEVLKKRASFIRQRLGKKVTSNMVKTIDLGSSVKLPLQYEAGHSTGYVYDFDKLPSEAKLLEDLFELCGLYNALTFRGGVTSSVDEEKDSKRSKKSKDAKKKTSLNEKRQYSLHKKIDRNSVLIAEVKKVKGYRCEVCGMSLEEKYGDLGREYIEAHHLVPISTLEEEVEIPHDPVHDFAVLCANCHRMIHRLDDPSDLSQLQQRIKAVI